MGTGQLNSLINKVPSGVMSGESLIAAIGVV
jgi:hypothetical protein